MINGKDKLLEELKAIARLIEYDNDEGAPLYQDGDFRIGFKAKDLLNFIGTKLLEKASAADPDERTFILTDSCMWESNKQNGTRAPHAIEVVDEDTGQTHWIKSGSRIRFLGGMITMPSSQDAYNQNKEVEYGPETDHRNDSSQA